MSAIQANVRESFYYRTANRSREVVLGNEKFVVAFNPFPYERCWFKMKYKIVELVKMSWSDANGEYLYNNLEALDPESWCTKWGAACKIISIVAVKMKDDGDFDLVAHVGLRNVWSQKNQCFTEEIGLAMVHPKYAASGVVKYLVSEMFRHLMWRDPEIAYVDGRPCGFGYVSHGKNFSRCSLAHQATQAFDVKMNRRFAGLDFVKEFVPWWNVVAVFDNADLPSFVPQKDQISNVHGEIKEGGFKSEFFMLYLYMTTLRGSGRLPPSRFHVLPELVPKIMRIITANLLGYFSWCVRVLEKAFVGMTRGNRNYILSFLCGGIPLPTIETGELFPGLPENPQIASAVLREARY